MAGSHLLFRRCVRGSTRRPVREVPRRRRRAGPYRRRSSGGPHARPLASCCAVGAEQVGGEVDVVVDGRLPTRRHKRRLLGEPIEHLAVLCTSGCGSFWGRREISPARGSRDRSAAMEAQGAKFDAERDGRELLTADSGGEELGDRRRTECGRGSPAPSERQVKPVRRCQTSCAIHTCDLGESVICRLATRLRRWSALTGEPANRARRCDPDLWAAGDEREPRGAVHQAGHPAQPGLLRGFLVLGVPSSAPP
jgi:hypothetical protein